jgi:hypothetical protein
MNTNPDPTSEGKLRYPEMEGYFALTDFFVLQKGTAGLVPCRCSASCLIPTRVGVAAKHALGVPQPICSHGKEM